MLLSDEKCVDDEVILCVLAQWLVILINAGCVLFLGINFGSNWFTEKRDLVKKYFRVCRMKSCRCFVDNGNDESALPCTESYVEMNDDGFDDDDFTSGIGNVKHIGGDDECHQL